MGWLKYKWKYRLNMAKISGDNLECECKTHNHIHPDCTQSCTCHNNGLT